MSEFDITPGPWTYGVRKDGSIWLSIGDRDKGPHRQADIWAREADVRLMTAAPELSNVAKAYEAWEAALVFDGNWNNGLPAFTQPLFDRFLEIQAMRNSALAKAEGRS